MITPRQTELLKKLKTLKHKNEVSNDCSKKKVIGYLYRHSINFLPNDKINPDFPKSDKFLQNLIHIHTNKPIIHHSHVTGNITGFAHEYCNSQVRENYFNIPVIAHNQYRFDFFLFLKELTPTIWETTIWETTDINIGGRNKTDINFAIIQNQVRFIDTVKYFQQSFDNLTSSMREIEKKNVRKNFKRLLADKLFSNKDQENWVLDYLTSGKGIIPYQVITNLDSLNSPQKMVIFLRNKIFILV